MEQTIFIKSTGVTVVDVLKALSRGLSPEQVVRQYQKLTLPDVLATLQMAASIIEQYVTSEGTIRIEGEVNLIAKNARLVNVSKMREAYPRAYESWTKNEINGLIEMFRNGTSIKDMAESLGRGEGAVQVRLEKLGLLKPRRASQLPRPGGGDDGEDRKID